MGYFGAPLRVLVANDDAEFAGAVATALAADERIAVVGVAANGKEAVELAAIVQPDVVVLDAAMPVLGGVDAAHAIRAAHPNVTVVIVSSSDGVDGWSGGKSLPKDGCVFERLQLMLTLVALGSVRTIELPHD